MPGGDLQSRGPAMCPGTAAKFQNSTDYKVLKAQTQPPILGLPSELRMLGWGWKSSDSEARLNWNVSPLDTAYYLEKGKINTAFWGFCLRLGSSSAVSCWALYCCSLKKLNIFNKSKRMWWLGTLGKRVFLFPYVRFYYFPGTFFWHFQAWPLCWASSAYWRISVDTAEHPGEFWNQSRGKNEACAWGEGA